MTEYPKTLVAQVTQDDIDHGVINDCVECPINRAVLRTLGGSHAAHDVCSYPESIHIVDYTEKPITHETIWHDTVYLVTKRARRFMARFDTGKLVAPTTFRFRQEAS